jgi:hypothetical protein
MNKIQRTSRIFRVFFLILIILLPILSALYWFFNNGLIMNMIFGWVERYGGSIQSTNELKPHIRFFCFLISFIPIVVQIFVLRYGMKLCRLYENLKIFTMENVQYYKKIGYTLLIGKLLLHPIFETLITLTLSYYNTPGERYIAISLDVFDFTVIFLAVMFIFMSWVMGEGVKLEEDKKYTV